ncbi:hypothetical protein GQ43DRAFT_104551 [Delitschia confertaspora ATCC 74209]|uniref:Uncharacterized protein n=1 Tax=Delitschia confertaspora ATCC 74209 TaxID=1513339 RepID=A0A9P4JII6_9PLEO|nr:hypothetical protein GQ43DRAFT_104551 [Delitschia confertaspora ATCC 74209]
MSIDIKLSPTSSSTLAVTRPSHSARWVYWAYSSLISVFHTPNSLFLPLCVVFLAARRPFAVARWLRSVAPLSDTSSASPVCLCLSCLAAGSVSPPPHLSRFCIRSHTPYRPPYCNPPVSPGRWAHLSLFHRSLYNCHPTYLGVG